MTAYDDVAEVYDSSRGGESRGDVFAGELDHRLPAGEGPVLEVGVGTGVVALGLRRRGREVIGVDVAAAMLARARARLGPVVVRADARRLPFADASIPCAVSVWVAHAVEPPEAMFAEVARVLSPGGRYLVCPTNRVLAGDPIEPILAAMFARAEQRHPSWRPSHVAAADLVRWGEESGFAAGVESFTRCWTATATEQERWIHDRVWPALRGLDDDDFRQATEPALEALASLPEGEIERCAATDIVVLRLP
jgi:ubiquinone/menaquinone biosynthesis C-methylase UbiE